MTQDILTQYPLPDKKMGVGDVYERSFPLSFPSATGAPIQMTVTKSDTLVSIENGIAWFNTHMNIKMDFGVTDSSSIPFSAYGEGYGKVSYDIKEEYPKTIDLSLDLIFKTPRLPEGTYVNLIENTKYTYTIHPF